MKKILNEYGEIVSWDGGEPVPEQFPPGWTIAEASPDEIQASLPPVGSLKGSTKSHSYLVEEKTDLHEVALVEVLEVELKMAPGELKEKLRKKVKQKEGTWTTTSTTTTTSTAP